MIFNKDTAYSIPEFRKWCPYLPKTVVFDEILIDIDNAEFMVTGLIGSKVMEVAETYYKDAFTPDTVPTDPDVKIKHQLVERVQHAVAFVSYRDYVINRDVSHGTTGRKSVLDAKNERQAWEFMIERDNDGLTSKMHLAINRLLQFLDTTEVKDTEGTAIKTNPHKVLLNNIELFQQFYPIDDSRLLFYKILPFQRGEQNSHIMPIVGKDRLNPIIEKAVKGDSLSDSEQLLFDLAGKPLALRTMAVSIKRLSVKLLPEGLIQQFHSSIQARSSSQPVKTMDKDMVIASLLRDAEAAERDLANHIASLVDGETYLADNYDVTLPNNSSDNLHFRI